MAPGEDIDSGLSSMSSSNMSLIAGSKDKDISPDKPKSEIEDDDDLDDEDLDETLTERLWGLTEMFPEGVRNTTFTVVTGTITGVKGFYSLSRTVTWLFFSSSVILFAPLIFEVERAQMEEVQRSQQKQVLLGPGSAMSGGLGMMPQVQR
ncbi:hypothetical protein L9F63_012598 [Diploptera punctata]|uniref:Mitochondrial import receptor subunit TOM22 homolog n=1 Tax=Diploptera punctata TaxID=6984 RepID=A0AAD8AC80_DIPPU|nr:hypothetical protein L9F63_012598 [Diploptera punctata]